MLSLLVLILAAAPATAANQSFAVARQNFVGQVVALRPEAGTSLGLPQANSKLEAPTPAHVAAQIAYFEGLERSLAGAPDEIDAQVMLAVARTALHELRDERGYLSDVAAAQAPYEIIQQQVAQAGQGSDAAADWNDIVSRAERVPTYVAAVRDNLLAGKAEGRRIYRGFLEKHGVLGASEASTFFASELADKARAQLSPAAFAALEPRLTAAASAAAAAYSGQSAFVGAQLLPVASQTYGIGEAEYAWKLRNQLGIKETPSQLQEKGRALAATLTARMEALAKTIDPQKTLTELMAALREDHPKNDEELLATYRTVGERARDFVVANKIFDIPADYRISIIETPAAMRSVIGSAAYLPAPPLQAGKKGVFLVTPSGGDAKRLAIHNFSKIPTTVVHEAFPGHDMQFWTFQRSRGLSPTRHLMDQAGSGGALNIEGYAHYAEELMRQRGFFTPKEELVQLASQLWRAWRVILDVAIHTGQTSLEDAAATLAEKAFLPQAIAQVEPFRYISWPTQAITYLLGRLEIESLKADYSKIMGSAYSEAKFHELFLSYGPVLPSAIRPALLAQARADAPKPTPAAPSVSVAPVIWAILAAIAAWAGFLGPLLWHLR